MYNSILVGTDGSSTARSAVARAARLAKLCDARLLIVCAYSGSNQAMMAAMASAWVSVPPQGDARATTEKMLSELASELRREIKTVETFAYPGNPAPAILEIAEAEKVDLIVLGNRGMQGMRRVLGSVPNDVTHQAPCSVLIVNTT